MDSDFALKEICQDTTVLVTFLSVTNATKGKKGPFWLAVGRDAVHHGGKAWQ